MKFVSFILMFTLLCVHKDGFAQENWTLKKDKNGIKVFSRKIKDFNVDELKVETIFEGSISQLAAVIFDVNNQYKWVYKTSKSQLLKAVNPADVYFYAEIECPWPFDNRDLISHMVLEQHPSTRVLTIDAKSISDYIPEKKGIVRIKYSKTTWTVTPINNRQFKVDYRIQIDLGDNVPAWLVNMFSINGPYESFVNLKEKMRSPQYAKAKFPMVVD